MQVFREEVGVAALARLLGRPVKWVEERRENLAAASQAREQRMEVERAADAEGRLLALRARALSDGGAYHVYPLTGALEPLGSAGILPGPYRTPAYAYEALAVATNKPPLGAYRGVGMTMGTFVMERVLDLLAEPVGLHPAHLPPPRPPPRRRHDHGHVRHGAGARPPGRAGGPRPGRDAPPQPDPARRLSVHVGERHGLRQRRLPRCARAGARRRGLRASPGGAARGARRWALSRHRPRLLTGVNR